MELSPKERLSLVSRIASTLQSDYKTSEINILLGGYGIYCSELSVQSKRLYVMDLLHDVENNLIVKIANDLEVNLLMDNEKKTSEIYFEQIQSQIKEELVKAKYLIWVAVAWFTDKELYDILTQKRKEGLSVQVLIVDDEVNNKTNFNFGKDFWVLKIPKKGHFENIMHHKYCIIDLKTILHGSYNWTTKAQFNNETIDKKNNREQAEAFADQFMSLKLEYMK